MTLPYKVLNWEFIGELHYVIDMIYHKPCERFSIGFILTLEEKRDIFKVK